MNLDLDTPASSLIVCYFLSHCWAGLDLRAAAAETLGMVRNVLPGHWRKFHSNRLDNKAETIVTKCTMSAFNNSNHRGICEMHLLRVYDYLPNPCRRVYPNTQSHAVSYAKFCGMQ